MLYELLTGTPPFTGDSPVAIARRHVREAPRPPSEAQPGVGREIDAIVLKALNKNPLNRYQTAAEMRSDLVRALSGQAVQAAQPSPLRPDGERTEVISGPPPRFGAAGSPALLAPLVQAVSAQDREPEVRIRPHRGGTVAGIGAVCLALAAAIWLTLRVVTATVGVTPSVLPSFVARDTTVNATRAEQRRPARTEVTRWGRATRSTAPTRIPRTWPAVLARRSRPVPGRP